MSIVIQAAWCKAKYRVRKNLEKTRTVHLPGTDRCGADATENINMSETATSAIVILVAMLMVMRRLKRLQRT